MAMLMFLLIMP